MKILMVHPHDIYSELEPWTVRITYIAREFLKIGHEIKLAYFPLWGRLSRENEPRRNQSYEEIPFIRKKSRIYGNILKMHKLSAWADIIHFQKCFSHAALPALFAAHLRNIPVHYDWDDWEMQIYNYASPDRVAGYFLDCMERSIPGLVNTVTVPSKRLKEVCLGLGVAGDRIFEAPVGADIERFRPKTDGRQVRQRFNVNFPLVMYLGQLHGAQYVELFIKAAKELLDGGLKADFMIVGDGDRAPELRHLSDILGLNGKITFTGAIPHEEVPVYLAACDVAVACFEDNEITRCKSPLKIVEYMASGCAIVASDVGEVRSMVDGSAFLCKAGDVSSLAKGIRSLVHNRSLRMELSKKARQRAELKYNWGNTAKNILKAYERAMEDFGG